MNTDTKKSNLKKRKQNAKKRQILKLAGIGAGIVGLVTCAVTFTSCGTSYDADINTLFLLKDGKVVTTDVEVFEKDEYSEEELNTYVQQNIDTYNAEHGENSVTKKTLSVNENVAMLTLEYADTNTYEDFYGSELFHGTIADAKEQGYDFDVEFVAVTDKNINYCTLEDLELEEDLKVVIVKANTKVQVDGSICYLSTEGVSEYNENWVQIKAGSVLERTEDLNDDTEVLTELEEIESSE
ncbi:MAG: hypothetical protein IKJ01_05285, partial [Lachnospiraceae bacterium]|nr:hypothetical protein [Lachnospiraceae bacterium]